VPPRLYKPSIGLPSVVNALGGIIAVMYLASQGRQVRTRRARQRAGVILHRRCRWGCCPVV